MSAPSRIDEIRARLDRGQRRRGDVEYLLAEIDALRQSLQRSDANQAQLVKAEEAYRASERAMLRRLSDLLTGGNAGTWDEIAHAAEQAESRLRELEQERDTERSRFAFYADTFGDLAYDMERLKSSDWGHLRHRVLGSVRAAVKEFRQYAAGQPSPSNWRRRAEAAESEVSRLSAQLTEKDVEIARLQQAITQKGSV